MANSHRAGGVAGLLAGAVCSLILGCSQRPDRSVSVFAAASLREALTQIGDAFEADERLELTLSFGASNALAAQIREGAPADVFVSADEKQMDALAAKDLVEFRTRFDLLSNRLVVVVPAESTLKLREPEDLVAPAVTRIALANPAGVPLGVYSMDFLDAQGVYDRIEPRVVRCNDARGTLAAVESGEADCGFVYRTDAAITKKVRTSFEVTGKGAPLIRYPAAQIRGCPNPDGAARFLRFLKGSKATQVFAAAGFILPA